MKNAIALIVLLSFFVYLTGCEPPLTTPNNTILAINLDPPYKALLKGSSLQLLVTIQPQNASDSQLLWTSNAEAIARVDQNGKVTALDAGMAVIQVVAKSDPAVKDTCVIEVITSDDITINISPATLTIKKAEMAKLNLSVKPEELSAQILWSSTDEKILTVNQKGEILGIQSGTVAVLAALSSDPTKFGICLVTVGDGPADYPLVLITPSSKELVVNQSFALSASVLPIEFNQAVSWKTDKPEVASVNPSSGLVTGHVPGNAIITATSVIDNTKSASCLVTVKNAIFTINPQEVDLVVKEPTTLTLSINPPEYSQNVTWSSDNPTIAAITTMVPTKTCTIKATGVGTTIIRVISNTDQSIIGTCTVRVSNLEIQVTPVNIEQMVVGETVPLAAKIIPERISQKVLWESLSPDIASVDANGNVKGLKACLDGEVAFIQITSDWNRDRSTYCTIKVVNMQLEVTPLSSEILVNSTKLLSAAITPADIHDKRLNWTTSNSSVVTVDQTGLIKGVAPGTAVVKATSVISPSKESACQVTVCSPLELFRTEELSGFFSEQVSRKWYYFNAAVGSTYEVTGRDVSAGIGYTAEVKISTYHADKLTPYFEDQAAGVHTLTSVKAEPVYIVVSKASTGNGSFSLSYKIKNNTPPSTWTLMVYMNAGMYLEDYCIRNVAQLIAGYHANCGINLLLLLDKETTNTYFSTFGVPYCDFADSRLFVINENGMHRVSGGRELPDITETSLYEANLGDAETLKRFIEYGKHNYPARYYGLIIKGHGAGSKGCCDDESAGGDRLHPGELSAVLDASHSLDLLGFNTCYMGSAEVAYQFRPREASEPAEFGAEVMLASACFTDPLGWQYDKILQRISMLSGSNGEPESLTGGVEAIYKPAELPPISLGRIITEEERDGLYAISPETGNSGMLTCYDLSKAAVAKKRIDTLAVSLAMHSEKKMLEELRDNLALVLRYYMIYPSGSDSDKAQRKSYPFYDLISLCEEVESSSRFSPESQAAATAALAAMDDLIVYSYNGLDTSNRYGLSVFFSNGDELYNGQPMFTYHWWYNALKVIDWKINTAEKCYGELSWCADKATNTINKVDNWFEMLDAWYDPNGNGLDGGSNAYQH